MKVTVISIRIGIVGAMPKALEIRLNELETLRTSETVRTTLLLGSVKLLSLSLQ